jgi:hypothetical protein
MIVYRYDENGFYVEPVHVEDGQQPIPINCTDQPLPQPNYKPQFSNGSWVETLTQEEIDALLNTPKPKSELEVLKENQGLMQKALDDLILGGAL